ncbi:MAG: ADP-ribosylglycohydrolase family protein [Actinomycetota bacterium]
MLESNTPLFSLLNGEGAGALLASAAGDVAGGSSSIGYSASTQQAAVLAYHLLRNDGVDRITLAREWGELAADGTNPSVYRAASADFSAWAAGVLEGAPVTSTAPAIEPAARIAPLGVWFRRDPDRLLESAIRVSRITHLDAPTAVATAATAGAVAALSFAQTGRDLLAGVAEVAERAVGLVQEEAMMFNRVDQATDLPKRIREAEAWLGLNGPDVLEQAGVSGAPDAPEWAVVAVALAAVLPAEPYRRIEEAARLGGSTLGSLVGALVGARVGLRVWPWVIPNNTWFAEIGRRLVSGNRETRDLPVPYQVEAVLTFGIERDPHERFLLP